MGACVGGSRITDHVVGRFGRRAGPGEVAGPFRFETRDDEWAFDGLRGPSLVTGGVLLRGD